MGTIMKKTNLLISCASVFALLLGNVGGTFLYASKEVLQPSNEDIQEAIHETLTELNNIALAVKDQGADPVEKLDEYHQQIIKNFGGSADILALHKDIFNWIVSVGVHSPIAVWKKTSIAIDAKKYSALESLYNDKLTNRTAMEFIKHLAVLVRELHITRGHVEHASTALDFNAASSTVANEFSALTAGKFHQTVFDSTCLLLSSLYAIHQKPQLLALFKTHVLDNIRKNKDGSYILKLPSGAFQIYSTDRALKYPDSRVHTDFPMILRALSFYMAESMRFLGHVIEVESYTISDISGKDYFFGKPVESLGLTARVEEGTEALSPQAKQVILKKDGSMVFNDNTKDRHVTGDFFVTVASKLGVGGHAMSIYHDGHTWMLYDNLKEAAQVLTTTNMPTAGTSFYVVGNYTIQ
jgi:hypothetical protein